MLIFFPFFIVYGLKKSITHFQFAGQRVIGEPIAAGLALDESRIWDPDFVTAAKQESALLSFFVFVLFLPSNDFQPFQPDDLSYFRYVMSPPIRASGHDKALQAALSTGVLQVSTSLLDNPMQS